jgi:hypothetical protein
VTIQLSKDKESLMIMFLIFTRSKTGSIDQNIGDRTWYKIQFIHNSGFQGNDFPVYDAAKFEEQRKEKEVNLQLGSTECKACKSALMEPNLLCQFPFAVTVHTGED